MGMYTIDLRRGRATIAPMEGITRQSALEKVLADAKARLPAADETEAHFRFGKPATLTQPEQKVAPTITTTWPDDDDKPPEDSITVLRFDEVDRAEETIRVENPDDSEQYVMVKRCTAILFVGGDGIYRLFNFKNDEGG